MHPKNELVFCFLVLSFNIWKRSPFIHIYNIQFPSCEHTQYLGPLKETSTTINLGLHFQVLHYLEIIIKQIISLFFILLSTLDVS